MVNDREFYDGLRKRGLGHAQKAVKMLEAPTSDGMLAPHVAKERVLKLRKLARQINALAEWIEAES